MKNGMRILLMTVLAAAAWCACAMAQMPGMDLTEEMKEYLSQALPPYVGVVTFEPESPAAGGEVTVTASIGMIQLGDEESTSVAEALLHYTVDGGESWQTVDMEQGDDNEELWVGMIPGQDAGAEVEFYVTAVSEVGTLKFDVQDRQIELNIGKTQNVGISSADNMRGYDAENPDDSPFEHLTLIAEDAADEQIAQSADLRELRFGYDADNYYWKLKFDKKMDGGTISPLIARLYLGMFLNLNRGFDDFDATKIKLKDYVEQNKKLFPLDDKDAMLKEGSKRVFAWLWAPLLDAIPPLPDIGKIPKECLVKINPNNPKVPVMFDTTSVKTSVKADGTLEMTVPRAALGGDTDALFFLFGNIEVTGSMSDLKSLQVSVPDMAYPTLVKLTDYKYTVK